MDTLRTFELYLLSRMHGEHLVARALLTLEATSADMKTAQQALMERGLERAGASVDLYLSLLGKPSLVLPVTNLERASTFFGSKAYHFHLPLWPRFDFVIREHPAGYVWGPRFVRRRDLPPVPPLKSILDLQPWQLTAEEISAQWGPSKLEDAWSTWMTQSFSIPVHPGRERQMYLLTFDFELLQKCEASPSR